MDAEDKAKLSNMVNNLSDASPVGEWKAIVRQLGEMYKKALPETLAGGALTTEIGLAETDIAALITEFDADTSKSLK